MRAFEVLLAHGSCAFANYPYPDKPGPITPNTPMIYRAIAWGRVDPTKDVSKPARIKEALVEHSAWPARSATPPASQSQNEAGA